MTKMYRAGIDLGGTNIKAGIIDDDQNILAQASVPTRVERDYTEIIRDMAGLVLKLMEELSLTSDELAGVGIGSPGLVDAANGVIRYSNNFNWNDIPLVEEMHNYFQCDIRVSNDANCAALGEVKAGAARDCDNAILLTLGTGVGGGIIIDGKIFEGGHAGGAELGHTVMIADGEQCTCGRRGCVEAYVSASALIRDAKRAAGENAASLMNELCKGDLNNMNGKIPFDAAWEGDQVALAVVKSYQRNLGEAIANYVNIFRPDVVLISGGVCNQGDQLTGPLEEYLAALCFGGEKGFVPHVRCASLGNNAGLIGAANLITI